MEAKNLQTRFRIRIIRRLEPQFMDSHFCKKDFHETYQPSKGEAVVRNDALDLVELCEVGSVD